MSDQSLLYLCWAWCVALLCMAVYCFGTGETMPGGLLVLAYFAMLIPMRFLYGKIHS